MDKLQSKQVSAKFFSGNRGEVETEVNDWLSKDDRTVLKVLQSGEASSLTVSIWYRK
jgi:hypothetical protein